MFTDNELVVISIGLMYSAIMELDKGKESLKSADICVDLAKKSIGLIQNKTGAKIELGLITFNTLLSGYELAKNELQD